MLPGIWEEFNKWGTGLRLEMLFLSGFPLCDTELSFGRAGSMKMWLRHRLLRSGMDIKGKT